MNRNRLNLENGKVWENVVTETDLSNIVRVREQSTAVRNCRKGTHVFTSNAAVRAAQRETYISQ
jgi:hypothetical protein